MASCRHLENFSIKSRIYCVLHCVAFGCNLLFLDIAFQPLQSSSCDFWWFFNRTPVVHGGFLKSFVSINLIKGITSFGHCVLQFAKECYFCVSLELGNCHERWWRPSAVQPMLEQWHVPPWIQLIPQVARSLSLWISPSLRQHAARLFQSEWTADTFRSSPVPVRTAGSLIYVNCFFDHNFLGEIAAVCVVLAAHKLNSCSQ